jgi:hypothetical protein
MMLEFQYVPLCELEVDWGQRCGMRAHLHVARRGSLALPPHEPTEFEELGGYR